MNQIWTLVRKDARFAAAPILWLTAVVVLSLWGRSLIRLPFDAGFSNEAVAWRQQVSQACDLAGLVANITGLLQVVLTGLLCAHLLQQDSLTSDRAFWRTRPISPARLFVAKLGVAVVAAVLLPALGAALVWTTVGAPPDDVWSLALTFVAHQATLAAAALGFAAITANLASFVFAAIGAGLVLLITSNVKTADHTTPELSMAVFIALVGWPILLWLVSLPARRPALGWIVYALGLALLPAAIVSGSNARTTGTSVSSVRSSMVLPLAPGAEAEVGGSRCRIAAVEGGEVTVGLEGIQLPGESVEFELLDATGQLLATPRRAMGSSVSVHGLATASLVLSVPADALGDRSPEHLQLLWRRRVPGDRWSRAASPGGAP